MLWKDLVQGDKNCNTSHQEVYLETTNALSFHIFTLTQKTARFLLFHSNFTIIVFICVNCINCFISIIAFHLWKQIFIEFVEVRYVVVKRQKYIPYNIFHLMGWTDYKQMFKQTLWKVLYRKYTECAWKYEIWAT